MVVVYLTTCPHEFMVGINWTITMQKDEGTLNDVNIPLDFIERFVTGSNDIWYTLLNPKPKIPICNHLKMDICITCGLMRNMCNCYGSGIGMGGQVYSTGYGGGMGYGSPVMGGFGMPTTTVTTISTCGSCGLSPCMCGGGVYGGGLGGGVYNTGYGGMGMGGMGGVTSVTTTTICTRCGGSPCMCAGGFYWPLFTRIHWSDFQWLNYHII
jgi:hypothetical protein